MKRNANSSLESWEQNDPICLNSQDGPDRQGSHLNPRLWEAQALCALHEGSPKSHVLWILVLFVPCLTDTMLGTVYMKLNGPGAHGSDGETRHLPGKPNTPAVMRLVGWLSGWRHFSPILTAWVRHPDGRGSTSCLLTPTHALQHTRPTNNSPPQKDIPITGNEEWVLLLGVWLRCRALAWRVQSPRLNLQHGGGGRCGEGE